MDWKNFFRINKFKVILTLISFLYFTNAYNLIPAKVKVLCVFGPCLPVNSFVPLIAVFGYLTLWSILSIIIYLFIFYSISCFIYSKKDIFYFRKEHILPFIILLIIGIVIILNFQIPKLDLYSWNVWIWWYKLELSLKYLAIPLINTIILCYFITTFLVSIKNKFYYKKY